MVKVQWLASLLLCSSFTAQANDQHQIGIYGGSTDLTWREFDNDDQREILIEEGSLGTFGADYAYVKNDRKFKADFTMATGSVDYLGERQQGTPGERFPSTSDYDNYTLELEYGMWFETDYIKPYAAIFGGYEQKNRLINPIEIPGGGLDEQFTHWFWGVLLEAEVFSWNGWSVDIGGEFSRTAKGENNVTNFTLSPDGRTDNYSGSIPLKSLIGTNFYGRINYEFLPTWQASLIIESGSANMEASYRVFIPVTNPDGSLKDEIVDQPEAKQETTYFGLRLQKTF